MDFSISELNYNSVETIPGFEARAAFTVNSATIFREDVDIVPTIVDDSLSYIPWGGDNLMPFGEFLADNPGNKGNGYRPGSTYGQGRKLEFRIPRDRYGNFHPSTTKRSCKASDFVDNGRELFMYDYSMGANNHVFRTI